MIFETVLQFWWLTNLNEFKVFWKVKTTDSISFLKTVHNSSKTFIQTKHSVYFPAKHPKPSNEIIIDERSKIEVKRGRKKHFVKIKHDRKTLFVWFIFMLLWHSPRCEWGWNYETFNHRRNEVLTKLLCSRKTLAACTFDKANKRQKSWIERKRENL